MSLCFINLHYRNWKRWRWRQEVFKQLKDSLQLEQKIKAPTTLLLLGSGAVGRKVAGTPRLAHGTPWAQGRRATTTPSICPGVPPLCHPYAYGTPTLCLGPPLSAPAEARTWRAICVPRRVCGVPATFRPTEPLADSWIKINLSITIVLP